MAEPTPRIFNHFSLVTFTPTYWALQQNERRRIYRSWLDSLHDEVDVVHVYQTFGTNAEGDLLVWCVAPGDEDTVPARFFATFARVTAPVRSYLTVGNTLWGLTRPSQYTKTRSTQELDPFADARRPYLIMYPFVKTPEWYLKDRAERQEMMMQHIKVGKQYKDITQLLLYSFGLQDQEFVVVYETDDLVRFLELVEELRGTVARLYTARDTPLRLGVHQPDLDSLAAWL